MTDNNHPITTPPELVEQWRTAPEYASALEKLTMVTMTDRRLQEIASQAARWGADQEVGACCQWLSLQGYDLVAAKFRAARRPKPPSLKEEALSEDREPASIIPQLTQQLYRRAKILFVRKVIDQALRDTASVQWRVADTGEQLVRATDLLAWAEHMEKQMEQLDD